VKKTNKKQRIARNISNKTKKLLNGFFRNCSLSQIKFLVMCLLISRRKKNQVHPAKACKKKSAELEAEVIFIPGSENPTLDFISLHFGLCIYIIEPTHLKKGLCKWREQLLIFFVPIPISIGIWLAQSTRKVPKVLTHTRSSSH